MLCLSNNYILKSVRDLARRNLNQKVHSIYLKNDEIYESPDAQLNK